MPKSKLTINVDTYLLEDAKTSHFNFSQLMEESIKHQLAYQNGNIESIDILLTQNQLKKAEKELVKIQAQVSDLRLKVTKYEELKKEREEQRLIEEKQRIETAMRCTKCANIIKGRPVKYSDKLFCQGCYQAFDVDDYKRYE